MSLHGDSFRFLNLGALKNITTQTIYHAVAEAVGHGKAPPTLIICWPDTPRYSGIVCCGFHQDIDEEVDLEFCRRQNIPVVRRILGGGAVYLDGGQIFYQVIAPRGHPVIPPATGDLFAKMLQAPVATYRAIGVDAVFSPVNDIKTPAGQKISGNGVGIWEGATVLTGNLIEFFDGPLMARVLKVPDEKFRDKIVKNLESYLGTIRKLAPNAPPRAEIVNILIKEFARVLNTELKEGQLTHKEALRNEVLEGEYLADEWLHMPDYMRAKTTGGRTVKISGGQYVIKVNHKAPGGLIRATTDIQGNIIQDIEFSGDFHFQPAGALYKMEGELVRADLTNASKLIDILSKFYADYNVESPGVTPQDFLEVFKKIKVEIAQRD